MHELSLVTSIVETVTESLAAYTGARVKEVRLRVGALASVIPESLEFCWGIVGEGTPGARKRGWRAEPALALLVGPGEAAQRAHAP